jgi:hypothetical protein
MGQAFAAYLVSQRTRLRKRLAMLRSGKSWTSEMCSGHPVDTTAETLIVLEDNLEEIDRLLSKASIPPDADASRD